MRVFAGLPLPGAAAGKVERWLESWKGTCSGLKMVKGELLHITLFFFGDMRDSEAADLSKVLDDIRSERISATLGALSAFPPRGNPRVIYLELEQGGDAVRGLYGLFLSLVSSLGYREERRLFVPHITMARNKGGSLVTLPEENPLKGVGFEIDRLILYESKLGQTGPAYYPLKTVYLR